MLYKNMIVRLEITDLNNLGFGVGRLDDQVIFVGNAVDGDVLDARIIKVNKTYAVARIETLLVPSRHRTENLCTARGCGGCVYGHISYRHELELKQAYVKNSLRKAGLSELEVSPILSCGKTSHYRNKAQYPISTDKNGRMVAGFYANHSHRVVPAAHCLLQPPVFGSIVKAVLSLCDGFAISPYCEETHTGLLRHIYLRQSNDGKEVLLTLVINGKSLPLENELAEELTKQFPALVGILINVNEEKTNVICGKDYRLIWGRDHLFDTLCGNLLKITPASFYQVNHDATELLYKTAGEFAAIKEGECVLDLFCGIGSIGLSIVPRENRLIGIEIVKDAVLCARENAQRNNFPHAEFYCLDAAHVDSFPTDFSPDVVLLDPPRAGCDRRTLDYVASLSPSRIVYISCNPDTLARDIAELYARTPYRAEKITPVDLFPRTGHVESVVCLTKSAKAT